MGFEGGGGELGEDRALERVDEADAEDVVADLGDARVGRGDRHHGDLGELADGGGFEGVGGGVGPDDGGDFVAGDEFLHRGGGLALFRLDVFDEVGEGAAEDTAVGVDFLDGEEDAFAGGDAEGGVFTGERTVVAEFDGFGGGGGECEKGEGERSEGTEGNHGSMVST